MYHQFKELADVDITAEPMEIGPTCHYVMGGVEVDPDTGMSLVEGLYAAGEVAGGMHGSNRLGGNSLSDLLVFGRRADSTRRTRLGARSRSCRRSPTNRSPRRRLLRCTRSKSTGGENPYTIQHDLQDVMQRLVGIIRNRDELEESLAELESLKERAKSMSVEGHRQYNPGWHLAIDIANMLTVSECIAKAALEREESRGGHTRDDFPGPDATWGSKNLVLSLDDDGDRGSQAPAATADAGRPEGVLRCLMRTSAPETGAN